MLKALVKKQLSEIFRMYFYDQKKNKARTKASTVLMLALFAVVIVGVLGGMFGFFAYSLRGLLILPDTVWFYFTLIGLLATVFGVFGSVFNTFSSLYLAKDNDLILSMPIPVNTVIASRLIGVYLMGALYSCTVLIPAQIIYFIYGEISALSVIGSVLFVLIITLFVFMLSCLLGYVVARISVKLKNKSFVTVLISLVFIAAYYFLYYKANAIISDIIMNAAAYGLKIRNNAYPLYLFGKIGEGDIVAAVIFYAVVAALLLTTWILIKKSFIKTATSTSVTVADTKIKEDRSKKKSLFGALLWKETKRFTSSPQYMLNCALGMVFLPAISVFFLFFSEKAINVVTVGMGQSKSTLTVIICAGIMLMAGTFDITAPSVSLEGKSLWIAQSLPVDPRQILKAKLALHIGLAGIATLICAVCAVIAFDFSLAESLFVIALPLIYVMASALFGLFLGVRHPNLTWTSEIIPIKQSLSVFIALFGGWAYCIVFGALYFLVKEVGTVAYLGCAAAVTALICVLLWRYLMTKGAKKYASL